MDIGDKRICPTTGRVWEVIDRDIWFDKSDCDITIRSGGERLMETESFLSDITLPSEDA